MGIVLGRCWAYGVGLIDKRVLMVKLHLGSMG